MLSTPSKRQIFHSQIRSKQINMMMNKIRIRITKQDRIYVLNNMVEQVQKTQQISKKQLLLLMKWGYQGCEQAIAVLGNFFIDGIIQISMFKECQEKCKEFGRWGWLGNNQIYLWMVHILYEKNVFGQFQLLFLVQTIRRTINFLKQKALLNTVNLNSFIYEHGLVLLRKICKNHTPAVELLLQQTNNQIFQNLLKNLISLFESGLNGKIMETIVSIIGCFCFVDSSSLNQKNLMKLLRICKFRQQSRIRCLGYQILTNNLLQKQNILSSELLDFIHSLLQTFPNQKKSVQLQLSYLFLNIVQKCEVLILQQLIYKQNLLAYLVQIIEKSQNFEIKNNCIKMLIILRINRFQLIKNIQVKNLNKFFYLESQNLEKLLIRWQQQKQQK